MKAKIYGLNPFEKTDKEQFYIVSRPPSTTRMHIYNLDTGESVCKTVKSRGELVLRNYKCSSTYSEYSMAKVITNMSSSTKSGTCPYCLRWAEKTYNNKASRNLVREGVKGVDYIEGD